MTAAFVAGVVHGFSSFGSAMVFLPVAGQFLLPILALTALTVIDAFGPLSAVPKALRDARKLDLLRLVVAMILVFPAALWLLTHTDPAVFRYLVSIMALVLLTTVLIGLRYRVICARACFYGIGALSGSRVWFLGMPGPSVIFVYLTGRYSAAVVWATTLLFLLTFDAVFLLTDYSYRTNHS